MLKLALAVQIRHIKSWYNAQLLPSQAGFRSEQGCSDAVFNFKQIHHIAHRSNTELSLLFVDLKAAYDWLCRRWLFASVRNRFSEGNMGVRKAVDILEELYKRTVSEMSDGGGAPFESTCGVRQGGTESPLLFNLYMDYLMRIYEQRALDAGLGVEVPFRVPNTATERDQRKTSRGQLT